MTRTAAIAALKKYPLPFIRAYVRRYNWKTANYGYKGAVVVMCKDNKLFFGWSLCNDKDQFDKKVGVYVALKRAEAIMDGKDVEGPIIDLSEEFSDLQDRALRYFKQAAVEYAK